MFVFFIMSELREAGRTEDGAMITTEMFFVVAERADGSRLAHRLAWPSIEVKYHEGQAYTVDRGGLRMAEKLLAAIEKHGGKIDETHWSPIAARYGSAVHDELDHYDEDDHAIRRRGG